MSELDDRLDRLFPLSRKPYTHKFLCGGSISGSHNEDAYGLCTWCGRKIAPKAVFHRDHTTIPDLEIWYRYHYDPDFNIRTLDNYIY